MNEIDLYSSYQLPALTNKKSKKPKHNKGKWFIFIIILVFIGIIIFLANAFANVLSFSSTSLFGAKKITTKSFNAYAIMIESTEDKQYAEELSQELQLAGAGGYIMYDLQYQVLASAYLDSNDAQSVLNKVMSAYPNAEIKILKINACELPSFSNKENNEIIKEGLEIFKTTYQQLYDLCIQLDTSSITSADCKVKITELLNSVSGVSSKFRDVANVSDNTKFKLTQAKIDQLEQLINELVESSLISTRLSSLIKYTQISCLMLQNELSLLLS